MFYSVQQGSRFILSLTNQRSSFEVRRLQHHQQIKAHGQPFCIMILVSLHTKSSSMLHAEFVYKLFPPKWRILTMKTLSYTLRRLSICSFDQITSLLFSPFQSCFIYHGMIQVSRYLLYRVTGPLSNSHSLTHSFRKGRREYVLASQLSCTCWYTILYQAVYVMIKLCPVW
jgi:hypothetical protein